MVEKFYYSMGEVTEMFDVEPSVIRYWCKQFSCLNPKRNAKGNRLFTAQDIERLKRIYHLLKEKRMTIEGAQKAMRKKNFVVEGDDADVALLEQLQVVRSMLVEMRDSLGEPISETEIEQPAAELVVVPIEQSVEEAAESVEAEAEVEVEIETVEEQSTEELQELSVDDIFVESAEDAEVAEPEKQEVTESAETTEVVEDVTTAEPAEGELAAAEPKKEPAKRKKRTSRRKLIGEEGVVERPLFPFYEQTLF